MDKENILKLLQGYKNEYKEYPCPAEVYITKADMQKLLKKTEEIGADKLKKYITEHLTK